MAGQLQLSTDSRIGVGLLFVIMMSTTLICSLQDKVDNHNYLCTVVQTFSFQNEAQGHSECTECIMYVDWKRKLKY